MLTMLLEFFLVHATGFFTVFVNDRDGTKWKRIGAIAGFSLLYVVMVGAYAWAYHEWWPLLAFGWLAAGKAAWVWQNPPGDDDAMMRQMAAWAGSVALFLGGVVLTCVLDVPRLGRTAALQPGFGLDMTSEGIWESQPHRVVAFGALYFGATLVAKALLAAWDAWRAQRRAAMPRAVEQPVVAIAFGHAAPDIRLDGRIADDAALRALGIDVERRLREGDFEGLARRFDYRMAHGRPVAQAIREDLARSLAEFGEATLASTRPANITVTRYEPNAAVLAVVACDLAFGQDRGGVLVELVVSGDPDAAAVDIEDISTYAPR
jgi:hypothetical protein